MKLRQILAAVLSGLVLLAVLAALPVLLLAVGGNPLPTELPSLDEVGRALTAPDDGRLVLGAAILTGWVCWALLLLASVAEAVDQLSAARGSARRPVRGAPALAMTRSLMRPLVASILAVLVSAPGVLTLAAGPAIAQTATAAPGTLGADDDAGQAPRAASRDQTPAADTQTPPEVTHTVQPGDTLWAISEDHLGSGQRYGEVYAENAEQLSSPDLIYPGTVLVLPGTPQTMRDLETIGVQVRAGDTLNALAQEHLGDAARWPEIFTASLQVDQGGGTRLSDPDLIEIGWELRIPTDTSPAPSFEAEENTTTTPPPTQRDSDTQNERLLDAATAGANLGRRLSVVDAPQVPGPQAGEPAVTAPQVPQSPVAQSQDEQPSELPAAVEGERASLPLDGGWLVAGLAGAGGTLAGALWVGLRSRRRTQARFRRPGKDVGVPVPVELGPIEATAQVVGPVAAVSLETLDRVLKHLVIAIGEPSHAGPGLVAVRLSSQDGVDVLFAEQALLPGPWQPVGEGGTRWRLARPMTAPAPEIDAPYPLLATVGTDDTEGTWLLNLEGMHVAISGDPTMGQDLARHVAAGMLLNPWSQGVQVDCLGLGAELEQMDPARLHVYAPDDALVQVHEHLAQSAARASHHQVDAATARVHAIGDDTWPARLVMVGVSAEATRQIAHTIGTDPSRVSAAIMVAGGAEAGAEPSLVLEVDAQGRVEVDAVAGLDLVAVGLTPEEATGCAMMCAAATDHSEQPVPGHGVEDPQDLRHYIDQAGGLREPFRATSEQVELDSPAKGPESDPGPDTAEEAPAEQGHHTDRVLAAPHEDYLDIAATTEQDLDQIAPQVSHEVRDSIHDLDPDLDEDLAAWHDSASRRPRLSLLGPVKARTWGKPLAERKAYLTEILTYLALRPEGVTPERLADAFGLTGKKARDYVSTVRKWLGTDPRTGQLHLPHADDVIRHDGVKVYRVSGLLVDADLFKRLHARGVCRGPDGIEDLVAALQLVSGQPFDQLRPGGWGWLFEGAERVDQYLVVGIGTVAHLITVHSLEGGNLERARWAAQVAKRADPYAETPNLDLAAVAMAQGRHQDSATLLRAHVTDRSDDHLPPPELPERTAQILDRHPDWLDTGRDAAAS